MFNTFLKFYAVWKYFASIYNDINVIYFSSTGIDSIHSTMLCQRAFLQSAGQCQLFPAKMRTLKTENRLISWTSLLQYAIQLERYFYLIPLYFSLSWLPTTHIYIILHKSGQFALSDSVDVIFFSAATWSVRPSPFCDLWLMRALIHTPEINYIRRGCDDKGTGRRDFLRSLGAKLKQPAEFVAIWGHCVSWSE